MKKFLLVSALVWVLVLTWCDMQKWLSQDELFEKKKECASMKDKIQEEQSVWVSVSEVFYSKKLNSCLYVIRGNGVKFIIDRFGDEFKWLYTADSELHCYSVFKDIEDSKQKCLKDSEKFEERLKKLKWE